MTQPNLWKKCANEGARRCARTTCARMRADARKCARPPQKKICDQDFRQMREDAREAQPQGARGKTAKPCVTRTFYARAQPLPYGEGAGPTPKAAPAPPARGSQADDEVLDTTTEVRLDARPDRQCVDTCAQSGIDTPQGQR